MAEGEHPRAGAAGDAEPFRLDSVLEEAEQSLCRSLLAQAMGLHETGDLAGAERLYRAIVGKGYRVTDLLPITANIAWQAGRHGEAMADWNALLALSPRHPVALLESGRALAHLGRPGEAEERLRAAAAALPESPAPTADLAMLLFDRGRHGEAHALCLDAARRWPEAPVFAHLARRCVSARVPFWHVPMVNDTARNEAFDAALRAAIAAHGPGAVVLDIGAGSGLLSLMAARAGAGTVVACEGEPMVAAAAREVLAANPLGRRVRLVEKLSQQMAVGTDLPAPADILVSEIISSDLLTEGILPTFEDAHARLLKPGATILPRAVAAVGCLVGGEDLARQGFIGEACGFDLSAYQTLSAPRLIVDGLSWQALSTTVTLLSLDLTRPHHPPSLAPVAFRATADGVAAGILQWLRIDLGFGATYENPPGKTGGWKQILHTFEKPLPVMAGQVVRILAGHDRSSLVLQP